MVLTRSQRIKVESKDTNPPSPSKSPPPPPLSTPTPSNTLLDLSSIFPSVDPTFSDRSYIDDGINGLHQEIRGRMPSRAFYQACNEFSASLPEPEINAAGPSMVSTFLNAMNERSFQQQEKMEDVVYLSTSSHMESSYPGLLSAQPPLDGLSYSSRSFATWGLHADPKKMPLPPTDDRNAARLCSKTPAVGIPDGYHPLKEAFEAAYDGISIVLEGAGSKYHCLEWIRSQFIHRILLERQTNALHGISAKRTPRKSVDISFIAKDVSNSILTPVLNGNEFIGSGGIRNQVIFHLSDAIARANGVSNCTCSNHLVAPKTRGQKVMQIIDQVERFKRMFDRGFDCISCKELMDSVKSIPVRQAMNRLSAVLREFENLHASRNAAPIILFIDRYDELSSNQRWFVETYVKSGCRSHGRPLFRIVAANSRALPSDQLNSDYYHDSHLFSAPAIHRIMINGSFPIHSTADLLNNTTPTKSSTEGPRHWRISRGIQGIEDLDRLRDGRWIDKNDPEDDDMNQAESGDERSMDDEDSGPSPRAVTRVLQSIQEEAKVFEVLEDLSTDMNRSYCKCDHHCGQQCLRRFVALKDIAEEAKDRDAWSKDRVQQALDCLEKTHGVVEKFQSKYYRPRRRG